MILDSLDLDQKVSPEEYKKKLFDLQLRAWTLGQRVRLAKRPVVFVFEGVDAAGKGGAIRRLTEHFDARGVVAHGIAAPAGEDKTRHYLYRFWRRLPDPGQLAIFDRSWYGRVLVERVEGFCSEDAWKRAYREINEFERQIVRFGTVLVKFWLQVSKEEQLKRFQARADDPLKSWKLTEEDWRNREKWDAYRGAIEEMLVKTSTAIAPWTVVEANDKLFSRIKVLKTACERVEEGLRE
jgi:polyphosphate kinase 2 (PPK2 family)